MVETMPSNDIAAAAQRISPHVRLTPVLDVGGLLDDGWNLLLKLDQLQPTGSFKVRGAFNQLLSLEDPRGVVAASGGNFGKAMAYAAGVLDIPATIFVPRTSPEEKTSKIGRYGADVRLIDGYYDDALEASKEFAEAEDLALVHAYDAPAVMAGQGTIGVEIEDQVRDVSTVLTAVGGGGLIGGVATWFHGRAQVVGVETELCPTLHEARRAGKPVDVDVGGIAASSLGARRLGDNPWSANRWITESILVSDAALEEARQWLWDEVRLWVEVSAAAPIAALRTGAFQPQPGDIVTVVISGANTTVDVSG